MVFGRRENDANLKAAAAAQQHAGDYGRVWMHNFKFQFFFRHLHGDLNLDKIKNALRLLSVNGKTNLMNLIRL